MQKVLIVVDMQNDFIDGSLGTIEAIKIVPNVIDKIKKYEEENALIYYTMDTHFEDYLQTYEGKKLPVEHCIKNTNGWMIPNNVLRNHHDKIIEKFTFGSKKLFDILSNINEEIPFESIELIGLCTDICVISNALLAKAYFPNVKIIVDSTCCSGVTKESHEKALATMQMCQIDIL